MRRRIAIIIAGIALLIGAVTISPSQAGATILCPPGCVLAGTLTGAGGQPDPNSLSIYGQVQIHASNLSGETAGVGTFSGTYNFSIYGGYILPGPLPGTLKGSVDFYFSRYSSSGYGYESYLDNVAVSGTPQHLKLEGSEIRATLTARNGGYTGAMIYADVSADLPTVPYAQQYCNTARDLAISLGVPDNVRVGNIVSTRPMSMACSALG